MPIEKYTNITIQNDHFSIGTEAEKPCEKGCALEMLTRIEKVIREHLLCDNKEVAPQNVNDKLVEAASGIKEAYFNRTKDIGKLRRWFSRGKVEQKERAVEAMYSKIIQLTATPPLPTDVFALMGDYLDPITMDKVGQIGSAFEQNMASSILRRARAAGYEGEDLQEAQKFLKKNLSSSIVPFLNSCQWLQRYIVYKSRWKSEIDLEATLKKLEEAQITPESLHRTLELAIIDNNNRAFRIAQLALHLGANPNQQVPSRGNNRKTTLLIMAVETGNEKMISLLLAYGADVNAKDEFGNTALHWVTWGREIPSKTKQNMARLLLKAGAKVDIANDRGEQPLHSAVAAEELEIAELLLENKADVNARNRYGETPLFLSIAWRKEEKKVLPLLHLLLQQGAEVNIQSGSSLREGCTPLHLAIHYGTLEMVKALAPKSQINDRVGEISPWQGVKGLTPLMLAVRRGDKEIVQYLLEQGANPTLTNENDETALTLSTNPEITSLLQEALERLHYDD